MTCIAICGDSASGKTLLANRLASKLGDCVILECDRYHKWERHDPRWTTCTQLNPDANDLDLLNQDVQTLKSGHSVLRRNYDHRTGTFTEEHEIKPATHIIVCGLHVFACPGGLYDLKIFLDPSHDLKTCWKIARDTSQRGYTTEQVLAQIRKRYGEYERYVEPLKDHADVVINRCESGGHLCSTMNVRRNIGPDLHKLVLEVL